MEQKYIAVIGDKDSVMLWKAIGAKTAFVSSEAEAEKAVHRFARDGASVIYITETYAMGIKEATDRYLTDPEVSIIPIPDSSGSQGYGMKMIKQNIEKAIGADILFGNEE